MYNLIKPNFVYKFIHSFIWFAPKVIKNNTTMNLLYVSKSYVTVIAFYQTIFILSKKYKKFGVNR